MFIFTKFIFILNLDDYILLIIYLVNLVKNKLIYNLREIKMMKKILKTVD